MTKDEILSMPAGPEIDALVAEALHWTPKKPKHPEKGSWYDQDGSGDYTTVKAACDYIATQTHDTTYSTYRT